MKKLFTIAIFAFILLSMLFIGFYETHWAEDNKIVFFIKKKPTLQIEFVNFFATDSEDKSKLHKLDKNERQLVIDYCKYHLGIEIEMKNQEEMDSCDQGYRATKRSLQPQ